MRVYTQGCETQDSGVWPLDTFRIPVMTNSTRPCEGLKPSEALSHLHTASGSAL